MTDYYIRTTGVDTNNGTSPATAWLTLNKAIGTGAGMVSGDRVFIGGGVYRLTAVQAVTLAPTAVTTLIGDPTGAYTGDAGEVVVTGYAPSDTSVPFTNNLFSFAAARNFYTWQFITFRAPLGRIFPWSLAAGCHDWTFQDCTFYGRVIGGSPIFDHITIAGSPSNLLFERCRFKQINSSAILAITSTLHTSDYDINVVFKNCYLRFLISPIQMNAISGTGAGIPYGVQLLSNTFDGVGAALTLTSAAHSIAGGASKSIVKFNILDCGTGTALNAGSTNQITSDFNRNPGAGAFTNVTPGAGDNSTNTPSYFPDMGQAANWGGMIRPFMSPGPSDPNLVFVTTTTGMPTGDLVGRTMTDGSTTTSAAPVGALARHDTAVPGSALSGDVGGWSEITGLGSQEYLIWVGAQATTISVKVKWDVNAGNTNKPQMLIIANARIGVTAQTITAAGTAGSAYETLTAAAFTPTAAGLVRVRVVSRSAAGNGVLALDSFVIS